MVCDDQKLKTKLALYHHHPPTTRNFSKGSRHTRGLRFGMQAYLRAWNCPPPLNPHPIHHTKPYSSGSGRSKISIQNQSLNLIYKVLDGSWHSKNYMQSSLRPLRFTLSLGKGGTKALIQSFKAFQAEHFRPSLDVFCLHLPDDFSTCFVNQMFSVALLSCN